MICVPNFDFWPQRRREKETFLNAWKIMKRKLMYDLCRFSQAPNSRWTPEASFTAPWYTLMLGMLLASGSRRGEFLGVLLLESLM